MGAIGIIIGAEPDLKPKDKVQFFQSKIQNQTESCEVKSAEKQASKIF